MALNEAKDLSLFLNSTSVHHPCPNTKRNSRQLLRLFCFRLLQDGHPSAGTPIPSTMNWIQRGPMMKNKSHSEKLQMFFFMICKILPKLCTFMQYQINKKASNKGMVKANKIPCLGLLPEEKKPPKTLSSSSSASSVAVCCCSRLLCVLLPPVCWPSKKRLAVQKPMESSKSTSGVSGPC